MVLAVVALVVLAVAVAAALVVDLRGRHGRGDVDLAAVRRGERAGLRHGPPAPPVGGAGLGL